MRKVSLEDCCEILDSKRVPITATNRKSGPYPYYGANGIQDYVDDYIFDEELVLLAEDGGNFNSTTKPIAYRVSGKCWVNNHAHVLKPLPIIDVDYLCYSLMFYKVGNLVNGATREKLTQAAMRKMQVHLRPMPEQINIVSTLRKTQRIIAYRRAQLAKLDELVKCRFVELFGDIIRNDKKWAIYNLGDITSSRLGKMLDTKHKTGRNNYPYLANFNVQWFHFELNQLNKMDFDDNERIEFQLKEGDILVCEGGEIGRCAVWHNELKECFFQKALHRVRCDVNKVLPDYVAWWFKYNCDHKAFDVIAGAKATIAHLPGVKLKKLRIAVPDIQLQRDFTIFLRRIDKLRIVIRQSLDEAQKLFESLMQEYFD